MKRILKMRLKNRILIIRIDIVRLMNLWENTMLLSPIMTLRFLQIGLPTSFIIWWKRWMCRDLQVVKDSLWFRSWSSMKMRTKLQSKTIKSGMEKSNFTEKGCWNSASFFYCISSIISSKIWFFSNPPAFGFPLCQGGTFFSPLDKEGAGEICFLW